MATLFVDKVDPQSGTNLEIGSSGDTIALGSGATQTIAVNTPAFYAYLSANQTGIPNTTHTKITYNAELYDIGNGFNTSTNTYTIPESGKYYFSFGVRKDNTGANRYLIEIYKNGSSIQDYETGAGSAYGTSQGNLVQEFSANDTINVYLYQNSGGAATVRGGNGKSETWMYGFKIIE